MANKRLTDLTELTTPADDDFLYIVDISDTTESAQGTSKKIRKDKVDSGASKENIANKQNDLTIDGTGTKYPTVDAVNTIDLQKVINVNGTAEIQNMGIGYNRFVLDDQSVALVSLSEDGSTISAVNVEDGVVTLECINASSRTGITIIPPTTDTTLNFPAKTVAGTYTLATTDETVNLVGNQTIEGTKTFQNGQLIVLGDGSGNNPLYVDVNGASAYIYGNSSQPALLINNANIGDGLEISSILASSGYPLKIYNDLGTGYPFSLVASINKTGDVRANSFIKSAGLSTQSLMADGSVKELVSSTITNGVTDKSPSEDAVYDAFQNYSKIILKNTTTSTPVTGTLSQTILFSQLIPANTFKNGDFFNIILSRVGKVGTAGTLTQTIRINTSNTLTGSTIIASNLGTSANLNQVIGRRFSIEGTSLKGFAGGNASSDMINSSASITSYTFDPTVDNYIFEVGQLTDTGDSMFHSSFILTN